MTTTTTTTTATIGKTITNAAISYECIICFTDIDNRPLFCPKCNIATCEDCAEHLINVFCKEMKIPKCPDVNCGSMLLSSDLVGILNKKSSIMDKMYLSYFSHFSLSDSDKIVNKLSDLKLLEKIRKERIKYIDNNFPKAVALIAKITFNRTLKNIEKNNKKIEEKSNMFSTIKCTRYGCIGVIRDNVCTNCEFSFCDKCAKTHNDKNHVCNKDDIETKNMIDNMTKCPNCKLPIFKNEGCNSVTCAVCRTKFNYNEGTLGGHGSHNKVAVETIFQEKSLISFYKGDNEDIKTALLMLEGHAPEKPNKKLIIAPLKQHLTKQFKSQTQKNNYHVSKNVSKNESKNENKNENNNKLKEKENENDNLLPNKNENNDKDKIKIGKKIAKNCDKYIIDSKNYAVYVDKLEQIERNINSDEELKLLLL